MMPKVAIRLSIRGWASPCDDLKTLSVNGTFFELRKDKAAKGDRWTTPFICCAQDTVGL